MTTTTDADDNLIEELARAEAERDIARFELGQEQGRHDATLLSLTVANQTLEKALDALELSLKRSAALKILTTSLQSANVGITAYAMRLSDMYPENVAAMAEEA